MSQVILSTGNVMSAGPSIIRKPGKTRTNQELVNSLRDSFSAARSDYGIIEPLTNGDTGSEDPSHQVTFESWTERDGDRLYIPKISWQFSGLREEPTEYETTVKLFFLPGTPVEERAQYTRDALALVSKELGVQTVDLLIVSFPGMSFEGNCEKEAEKINAHQGNLDDEVATWSIFEDLHKQGVAKRLGIAEFGSEKLRAFLDRTSIHPTVDQINLQNCCNVPLPLKKIAEERGIELNVNTDSTDILPHETWLELLGPGPSNAGLLVGSGKENRGLHSDVLPQWVVRYTAFVHNRGVIENKGYFAGAALN